MDFNFANITTPKPVEERRVKVLIIGSGPAGLAAALYTARADLQPVVLTGMALGGQVSSTNMVENYPGFPQGVGGSELAELFQKQAERFGAAVEFDTVKEVDLSRRPFRVVSDNALYSAETLIVATGATPVRLDVAGETALTGRGVSYCGTCDGWFFKGKDIIVVGGGDSALEEALFLTRFANSVTIVHRRDALRACPLLQKRAQAEPKIRFVWDTVVTEILGVEKVEAVRLQNVKTSTVSEQPVDGVFIFVGHRPNTELFKDWLELDERGYIKTDGFMQTSVPGVYVAGEAGDPTYRQVITSAGMGASAGMQVIRYLEGQSK